MRKSGVFLIILLLFTTALFAQSREDILIHVLPVVAARPDHALFFRQHFETEVAGANYTLTDDSRIADFLINLEVTNNMVLYDDGWDLPPEDEPQFLVTLTLVNNETGADMVAFSWPFTETFEMYEHSLTMVYSAMANVPLTRLGDLAATDDRWRNQWLYIALAFNYPVISAYQILTPDTYIQSPPQAQRLPNMVIPNPGGTIAVEFQFLNWMMGLFNFTLRFGDPMAHTQFIPSISLGAAFPIKPTTINWIKIVPFLMASTTGNTATTHDILSFPRFSIGGGVQIAFRASTRNALFVDISYLHSLSDVVTRNPLGSDWIPDKIHYTRWVVSIGFGFKFGFMDRDPQFVDEED